MASAEAVLRYRSEGQQEQLRGARDVAAAVAQLGERMARAAQMQASAEAAQRRLAQSYQQIEKALGTYNQATLQAANNNEAVVASLNKLTRAETSAAQATTQAAQQTAKANDNASSSYASLAETITSATEIAVKHPIATAAAVAASAQALSSLSRVTSSGLSTASDKMREYSERTKVANDNLATLASVSAEGLGLAARYASTASDKLGDMASKFAPGAAGASILMNVLARIGPLLGPIGIGIAAIAGGALALEKAGADLEKMIALGERAERLDLAAPFVKSFDSVAKQAGFAANEVEASLGRVSAALREKYGQGNPLAKILSDLNTTGDAGLSQQVRLQAEMAQTTGQRLQVAIDAMRELEASGKRLALLDLADKLLGPEFAERLRTGQVTIRAFADDLDAARGKELLKPEDVARAVALQREIAGVKREIGAAWESTLDFSAAAIKVREAWLGVLKISRDVLNTVNQSAGSSRLDIMKRDLAVLENVRLPEAVSRGQTDLVETFTSRIAEWRKEIERLSATTGGAKPELDVSPPLRASSDELQRLTAEAQAAAGTIPGLDGALQSVASSAANAAAKIGSVADGIRALQNLNPNLAGALGYLDKVRQTQATYAETLKRADVDFQKSGDEAAKTQALNAALDEQQRTLKALAAERDKPLTSIVREGELSKLSDLDRSLAQIGDRMAERRAAIEENARLTSSQAATPEDAAKIKAQFDGQIAQLDGARKSLEAKARADAATKAASGGGGTDALDNALQRTRDETEELEIQAQALTKVSEEAIRFGKTRELLRAAAKSDRSDEAGLAETIDQVAAAYARQNVATKQAQEQQERMRESLRSIGDDFSRFFDDILLGSGKMSDAFASMAKGMASSGLQAVLTGQGPLAGILGTANPTKGEMGGLLGGIMPSAFRDAVKEGSQAGTQAGTLDGFGDLFKGASGKSLVQGAAGAAMIGGSYAIGAQSGSTMQAVAGGAASGAIGGAMLGAQFGAQLGASAGPIGAVVGAAIGIGFSLFGKSAADKAKQKAEREQYQQDRIQIEQFRAGLRGESSSGVEATIKQAYAQAQQAAQTAQKAGDKLMVAAVWRDYYDFIERARRTFSDAFEGTLAEIQAGLGTNGPFAQGVATVIQFGQSLRGFVQDAIGLNAAAGNRAGEVAREAALQTLQKPRALSEIETELKRIDGTGAGLVTVLKELGVSAEQAGEVIRDRTTVAINALRASFEQDLGRKLNDVQDKGYLNEVADLLKERQSLLRDATLLGSDASQVEAYITAAAQKIVTGAELTGDAFTALTTQFPDLVGRVTEFSQALDTAAAKAAAASRALGYQDRLFAATNDASTLQGQLAAFDRQAGRDRAEEAKAGGEAMVDLERALAAERLNIARDFEKQAAQAAAEARKAELDAANSAVDEARSALQQAYDTQASALRSTIDRLEAFTKSIRQFREGLLLNAGLSPLSPEQRLKEAQRQFRETSSLAQGGDAAAQDRLQSVSQAYLDEAKSYYASTEDYYRAFSEVQGTLQRTETKADRDLELAQKQLDLLDQQVNGLLTVNKSVLTVAEAIRGLQSALAAQAAAEAKAKAAAQAATVPVTTTPASGTASGTVAGTGSLSNADYVASLYQSALGRAPDANGLVNWNNQLSAGAMTREQVAAAIANSAEAKARGMVMGGLVGAYATGGMVMNGIWNRDSVLARYSGGGSIALAGGEYVMPAPMVTPQTMPVLDAMRSGVMRSGNDNGLTRADIAALAKVFAQEARAQTEALTAELAEVREELRKARTDQRQQDQRPTRKAG